MKKSLAVAFVLAACEPSSLSKSREGSASSQIAADCDSSHALLYGMNIDPPNARSNPSATELHDLGVRWVRLIYKWNAGFDYEDHIRMLRARNLRVLLVVNYESVDAEHHHAWSIEQWATYTPKFVEAAGAIAARFGDRVDAYEIWNEPDHHDEYLDSYVPAEVFGPMARDAAAAMRPHINGRWIVTGGLITGEAANSFSRANERGDLDGFEIAGLHPYGAEWDSGPLRGHYSRMLDASRRPLWITEIGQTDHVEGELPNRMAVADWMEHKIYGPTRDRWLGQVQVVFWFAWSDANRPWFGITDADGFYKTEMRDAYRRMSPASRGRCDPLGEHPEEEREVFERRELCGYPDFSDVDGRCVPSCGIAGGDTCDSDSTGYCDGYGLLEAYDCRQCCNRASEPPPTVSEPAPVPEEPAPEEPAPEEPAPEEPAPEEPEEPWTPAGCPCAGLDNFCAFPPGTEGCDMTWGGGYCDPNGDGSYDDADWERGYAEYHAQCG
jgi:hypothetical protein